MQKSTLQAHKTAYGLLLGVWVVAAILIGGALTSFHQPFMVPTPKILELTSSSNSSYWRAIHILSAECGCSQRVMAQLLLRGPISGVNEQLLMVEDTSPDTAATKTTLKGLREKGFEVSRVSSNDLQTYGLSGVPLLLIVAPHGKVVYTGGYGPSRNQIQDADLLRRVKLGEAPKPYPVIGCAVSKKIKQRLDPFGLKY